MFACTPFDCIDVRLMEKTFEQCAEFRHSIDNDKQQLQRQQNDQNFVGVILPNRSEGYRLSDSPAPEHSIDSMAAAKPTRNSEEQLAATQTETSPSRQFRTPRRGRALRAIMHAWLYVLAVLNTACTHTTTATIRLTSATSAARSAIEDDGEDTAQLRRRPRRHISSSSPFGPFSSCAAFIACGAACCSLLAAVAAAAGPDATSSIDPVALASYEKTLFAQLGLTKRPKIIDRASIVIPDELMETYHKMMAGHEHGDSVALPTPGVHTKSANTIRSYGHEGSTIDSKFTNHHKFRLYFNVSNIPATDLLKAAELSLSRRPIDPSTIGRDNQHHAHHHHQHHNVLVYDIVRPGVRGKSEPLFLLIDTKRVRITGSDTIRLDVQPAVERWLRQPHANHGLLVHIAGGHDNRPARHRHVRLRRAAAEHADDADDRNWARNQPFLFAYTDDQRHRKRAISDAIASRKTRAAARRAGRQKMVREICQRRSLYVDFSNVGWSDWIVAPPGYDAFYCHGECHFPQADHLNATNHAVVQALIHTVEPKMAPKVCCVPTQLNPISMLYLDDQNKVVLKNYQDMSVVGCGCR